MLKGTGCSTKHPQQAIAKGALSLPSAGFKMRDLLNVFKPVNLRVTLHVVEGVGNRGSTPSYLPAVTLGSHLPGHLHQQW